MWPVVALIFCGKWMQSWFFVRILIVILERFLLIDVLLDSTGRASYLTHAVIWMQDSKLSSCRQCPDKAESYSMPVFPVHIIIRMI